MQANCESDVKLPKAGCQKFCEEFMQHVGFDPLKSVSPLPPLAIASGAKKLVPINTIASQPPQGWHGSRYNQSIKALKWLTWCEHQLPHSSRDHIRTVQNGGEVCIANHLVDRYDSCDPITHRLTVYQFHGCLWRGCPR